MRLFALLCWGLLGAGFARADTVPPEISITPYDSAGWFNPAEGGYGVLRQMLANNLFFGTIYTYKADGTPTWLILQQTLQFTTDQERIDSGVIARVSGPLLEFAGGPCLGCNYTAPTGSNSQLGNAEFFWKGSGREMTIRRGGIDTPMVPLDAVNGVLSEQIEGTYTVRERTLVNPSGTDHSYRTSSCKIRRVPNPSTRDLWERKTPDVRSIPTQGAIWFVFDDVPTDGISSCPFKPSQSQTTPVYHLTFNPASKIFELHRLIDRNRLAIEIGGVGGWGIETGVSGIFYRVGKGRLVYRTDKNTAGDYVIQWEGEMIRTGP